MKYINGFNLNNKYEVLSEKEIRKGAKYYLVKVEEDFSPMVL